MESPFRLQAPYAPMGHQPQAIAQLTQAFRAGAPAATLLGVTGSGKTFTMANVIAQLGRPALVLSHNKTLAAQLYSEFKGFFPENAVEYFVSYYDYYQPEAYVPSKDLYIEKESQINAEIDKLRLSATRSLLSRRDVIIVASVSAIYGLGSPSAYADLTVGLSVGQALGREELLLQLVHIQYTRGDLDFQRGRFRVRGDVVEVWPAYEDSALRIEFFGDEVERLRSVHPLTGEMLSSHERLFIYPAKHFVVEERTIAEAMSVIRADLKAQHSELLNQGRLVEAQRLLARTTYDLEMMEEVGYCPGIENYARYLSGRNPGERPYCLYDFFPPDFLCIVDESHVTIPQIGGMYAGDRSRKTTLVDHGFRLPSALDNRPMTFSEWETMVKQVLFVSATPGPYEAERETLRAEQLVRPTGLIDPEVLVRPTTGQVEDLIHECQACAQLDQRVLVTTITKRLAEDLAEYLGEAGLRCTYLHSDLDALERIDLLQELRRGQIQVLVGVNLLREGLDLPEVGLVAILDADKEGFLRSETSLIQTMGRAARNLQGRVILYADGESKAMRAALTEAERRRAVQLAYNAEHGITPRSAIRRDDSQDFAEHLAARRAGAQADPYQATPLDLGALRALMLAAAEDLRFEDAARLRDRIKALETGQDPGDPSAQPRTAKPVKRRRRR